MNNIKRLFKILFLIFLVFFEIKISAKTYGIEYKPIETLDLKVDEIKKYRFYKERKISAYFIEDENPDIFKKKNDYYYTDYSEWSKSRPNSKKNREIKERTTFVYSKLKKIKNIYVETDDPDSSILEFAIYFNGFHASNNSFCGDCSDFYYMKMSDNQYDSSFRLNKLSISYNDYYPPNEISFKIMFNKENINYKIRIYDKTINDVMYEANFISDLELHEYRIDDFEIKDAFEEEVIKYEEDNEMYLLDSYKEYAYKDKYYLYEYNLKEYYPTYEEKVDGYIKDESDFIIEKKYSYLETAIIKDKIVINNENYDLNDYIKTSIPYEISSNIDISKNGTYKIKYIFPAKTIEKEVKVNTNREYIDSLENGIKNKNEEIKKIAEDKNELIERLENTIKTKDEIISKKQVQKSVIKTSKIPIVLITMGIMLIIICIIRSFKKTVELKK